MKKTAERFAERSTNQQDTNLKIFFVI